MQAVKIIKLGLDLYSVYFFGIFTGTGITPRLLYGFHMVARQTIACFRCWTPGVGVTAED